MLKASEARAVVCDMQQAPGAVFFVPVFQKDVYMHAENMENMHCDTAVHAADRMLGQSHDAAP